MAQNYEAQSVFVKKFMKGLNDHSREKRLSCVHRLVALSGRDPFYESIANVEGVIPSVQTFRYRQGSLTNLTCEGGDYLEAGLRFLMGQLSVNFTPLWDTALNILDSYYVHYGEKSWEILKKVFSFLNDQACQGE